MRLGASTLVREIVEGSILTGERLRHLADVLGCPGNCLATQQQPVCLAPYETLLSSNCFLRQALMLTLSLYVLGSTHATH